MALFNRPNKSDQLKGAWKSLKSGDGLSLKAQSHHSKQVRDERQEFESKALLRDDVLAEILKANSGTFEIREWKDGKLNVYKGHDLTAFVAFDDNRNHSHEVFDGGGKLLYHRDQNGRVVVDDEKNLRKYALGQEASRRLLS